MKKFVTIAATAALALSLFACASDKPAEQPETNEPEAQQPADQPEEGDAPEGEGNVVEVEGETNGDVPSNLADSATMTTMKDFEDLAGQGKSAEEIAEALSNADYLPFAGAYMQVEPGYLAGFDAEITGFDKGYMFGPAISSIPFVGYVFEVSGDMDEFTSQLTSHYDLAWNICTQADEFFVAKAGNLVFFAMGPESFDE